MSNDFEKIILSISDLHLGAGEYIFGQKNLFEDFFHDQDLIEFFKYYSQDIYEDKEVEVVINGDFLDFSAITYVQFFDDEFWSEEASIEKLRLMYKGHKEVFKAMDEFLKVGKKTITYVVGNHDAELILEKVRETFKSFFQEENRKSLNIHWHNEPYNPAPGIYFQHGHQYERAHQFDSKNSVIKSQDGRRYFIPPWGTYYCYHVLNKYKPERRFINQITPVRNFLIRGMVYDTLFTARFIFANVYYFAMMRFWSLYLTKFKFSKIIKDIKEELVLFENYEKVTRKFFRSFSDAKLLVTGHSHDPTYRIYSDNTLFINTGTWTRVVNFDPSSGNNGYHLTYAKIELKDLNFSLKDFQRNVRSDLLEWQGAIIQPFKVFNG